MNENVKMFNDDELIDSKIQKWKKHRLFIIFNLIVWTNERGESVVWEWVSEWVSEFAFYIINCRNKRRDKKGEELFTMH